MRSMSFRFRSAIRFTPLSWFTGCSPDDRVTAGRAGNNRTLEADPPDAELQRSLGRDETISSVFRCDGAGSGADDLHGGAGQWFRSIFRDDAPGDRSLLLCDRERWSQGKDGC